MDSSQRRIDEAADAWVVRLRRPLSDREAAAFDEWRAADPRHETAYLAATAFMADATGAARTPMAEKPPVRHARSHANGHRFRPALAAAVGLALATAGVSYIWRASNKPVYDQIVDARSGIRTQQLADGSIIILDSGSAVTVDFGGTDRRVDLVSGRARFTVAHDAARPFVVSAGDRTIIARGTIFDVERAGQETRVTLIEGLVDVVHAGPAERRAPVRLAAGQTLTVSATRLDVAPTVPASTLWSERRVSFDNAPLDIVIARTNRNAVPPIRFGDPALAKRRVTGVFDLTETRSLARKLAAALDLAVRETSGSVILEPRT